jgi:hypothetical protein
LTESTILITGRDGKAHKKLQAMRYKSLEHFTMDVKTIIQMIVDRYEQKSLLPPMKTRLIKLLYLTELEYFRRTGKRLTALEWRFYHFGPYASALEPYVGAPGGVNDGLLARMIGESHGEIHPDKDLQHAIVDVVHEWGFAELNTLLDHVYFETEPMQAASRGDFLDFSTTNREKSQPLSLNLDKKKLKTLREKLRQRASEYADLRQPSTGTEDLFVNLRGWDLERSVDLKTGSCSIDPGKLNPDK